MKVKVKKPDTKVVPYVTLEKCMELVQLSIYMALREEFGFGKARLERVYHASYREYKRFRDRYCLKEDLAAWRTTSPDGEAMKQELLTCGFDFDALNAFVEKNAHKWRFHGNQYMEGGKK